MEAIERMQSELDALYTKQTTLYDAQSLIYASDPIDEAAMAKNQAELDTL